jgi:hypothetical protein
MLKSEKANFIAHGSIKEEVRRILKEIYPPKLENLGVVVLYIQVGK